MSAAIIAAIGRAPVNAVMLGFLLAFVTKRDSVGPALFFDVFQAGVIVGELRVELVESIPKMLRNRLLYRDVLSSGHDLVCRIPYVLSRDNCRNWLELWYPLIFEVPMTRDMCVSFIRDQGWTGQIPHSACYMCPNHSDAEWIDMKMNWPRDFAAACELEAEARVKDPHFYLHPSCVPLAEVDFFAQHTMFAERGCYQGCFT